MIRNRIYERHNLLSL